MEKGVVVIVCNKDRNTYVTKHDIREIKNLLNFKKRLTKANPYGIMNTERKK